MLTALENRRLSENSLVLFSSDNGGELNFTNNSPLREGKGTLYEGGTRVPFIARWPGHIPAGQVSEFVICSVDLLPTVAALSGASIAGNVDGGKHVTSQRAMPVTGCAHDTGEAAAEFSTSIAAAKTSVPFVRGHAAFRSKVFASPPTYDLTSMLSRIGSKTSSRPRVY